MQTLDAVTSAMKLAEPLTTLLSMLAAVFAGISAWLSYRLTLSIRLELKADEVLVAGVLVHPSLKHPDHENSVLVTTLFNKSKRKCVITRVEVFDDKGVKIDVDWSETLDAVGSPVDRAHLIGVTDKATLCVRRVDGRAFRSAVVNITHSFDAKPLVATYEMGPGWQEYFAR